jgi:hypothetical protein
MANLVDVEACRAKRMGSYVCNGYNEHGMAGGLTHLLDDLIFFTLGLLI